MDEQGEEAMVGEKKSEGLTETKRVSRNMNEKKRRDRFNVLINELALVISPSNRNSKYEKITVLKDAIACLRNQQNGSQRHGVTQPQNNWQTTLVGGSELSQIIVEAMNGFVLCVDCSGIITFSSDSILSALGYRSKEMIDNSIADFLDQTDRSSIFAHLSLLQKEVKTLPPPASHFTGKSKAIGKALVFQMNLVYGPHIDKKGYVTVNCCGQPFTMSHNDNLQTVTQANGSTQSSKIQLVIVGTLRLPKPNIMVPLSNIKVKEFSSRLTLGWTYTFVDPRALFIVGYLPNELLNKSAYMFFHEDDIENVSLYHEMLGKKGRINTCYYRFLTKGQSWVWLQSSCYVSYNQWNSKPEYVTSTTTVVNYEEVCTNQENLLKEDRLKFQNSYKKKPLAKSPASSTRVTPQTSSTMLQELPQEPSSNALRFSNPLDTTKLDNNRTSRLDSLPEIATLRPDDILSKDLQNLVPEPMDEDFDMHVESISSDKSEFDLPLSTVNAPEGLTPAQSKLHVQLQGKHKLLEKSIKYQIDELERIKKQIEINKQLWEFNKQLQEKKSEEFSLDRGSERTSASSSKRGLQSESNSSGAESTSKSFKRSLVQSNREKYPRQCQVEIPVSHYIDIPPINLGDPSILYGMDQMDQLSMDSNNYVPFSNSTSTSHLPTQPYSYFPYQPQNR